MGVGHLLPCLLLQGWRTGPSAYVSADDAVDESATAEEQRAFAERLAAMSLRLQDRAAQHQDR